MTSQHLQILKTPFQTYYIEFDLNLLLTLAFLLVYLRFRTSGMRKQQPFDYGLYIKSFFYICHTHAYCLSSIRPVFNSNTCLTPISMFHHLFHHLQTVLYAKQGESGHGA